MVGPSNGLIASGYPSSGTVASKGYPPRSMSDVSGDVTAERDGLQPPRLGPSGRSMSTSIAAAPPRSSSLAASAIPGSFSSDLRSTMASRTANVRSELGQSQQTDLAEKDEGSEWKQKVTELKEKLNKEMKIKEGSENLLEALNMKKAKQTKDQRSRVELELNSSNRKIGQLKLQIDELQPPKDDKVSSRSRISQLFRGNLLRTTFEDPNGTMPIEAEGTADTESPTFALSEILQSLEAQGMQSDYYIERANNLVELFKKHPTLKYDLAWSDFGLRMQTMLLSDSREVVAAGYRVTRYAITDRSSLQTIRRLNTDYLVML